MMAFDNLADHVGVVAGAAVRMRRSDVADESPATNELRPGEVAVNTADGVMYLGKSDGNASTVASIEGANKIVVIEDAAYQALVDATATVSTTLYIVTPDD
jgi:hypothetical protein